MPVASYRRGTAYLEAAIRGGLYQDILDILGPTGTLIPVGDPLQGALSGSTLTTLGSEQVTFTASKAWNTWDTKPGKTGVLYHIRHDGVDEEADSPDAAYWSRVAGAFSIVAAVNLVDATSSTILSKFDSVGNTREWVFQLGSSDKLQLVLYDESVAANPTIDTLADSATSQNAWHLLVGTYDGTANASGINLYEDGALAASTDTDDAAFVNLEDLAGTVKLGHINATPANLFDGRMCLPAFVQKELNVDEVDGLWSIYRRGLNL